MRLALLKKVDFVSFQTTYALPRRQGKALMYNGSQITGRLQIVPLVSASMNAAHRSSSPPAVSGLCGHPCFGRALAIQHWAILVGAAKLLVQLVLVKVSRRGHHPFLLRESVNNKLSGRLSDYFSRMDITCLLCRMRAFSRICRGRTISQTPAAAAHEKRVLGTYPAAGAHKERMC